jgi:hypothetical protein
MPAVAGYEIGHKIARALGLRETTFIQITIPLDGPVEVACRYYPDEQALHAVLDVLNEYHIVPKEPTTKE